MFEHSPWIAERAWAARPFASVEALHAAMTAVVRAALPAEQLALLRAHPDLAGRAVRAGTLGDSSRAEQSSAGTVKERLGTVNVAIEIAGQHVEPGDIVVADDDGVVIVQRERAQEVLDASRAREAKEEQSRARYAAGELSLDLSDMRGDLERKGLRYE